MNENSNDNIKNLDFLVIKSRELIQEQLKSYESATSKAGILISISALLPSIVLSFISSKDTDLIIKTLTIVPTVLMIFALIYLLMVLMPKKLDHGFNVNQFDRYIDKPHKELLLFEIGANRDSYRDNEPIVNKQNWNFKFSVNLIFSSSILLLILVTISLFL